MHMVQWKTDKTQIMHRRMCVVKIFTFLVCMFLIYGSNTMLITLVEACLLTKSDVIRMPTRMFSTLAFTFARTINVRTLSVHAVLPGLFRQIKNV